MRVVCGWCEHATPAGRCDYCGHDPVVPWLQRGAAVPVADHDAQAGRPPIDDREIRRRLDGARRELVAEGHDPTVDAMAEKLDRSPRTVRSWKQRVGV